MERARILVIEDEEAIQRGLVDLLAYHGHQPTPVGDGTVGLERALSEPWDLLLVDVMLPGIDGFSITRQVRARHPELGILLLTAKGAESDILEGFQAGCDDYVTKPFSIAQLMARVDALLRRAKRTSSMFMIGPIQVDSERLMASVGDREQPLSLRDVEILERFTHAGAFRSDPSALEQKLGAIDLSNPASLGELQSTLNDPEVILGAIRSPEQEALKPQLQAVTALVVGLVDHVMDTVGEGLLGSYGQLTEALRRRRVEADPADRFVERMLGLELTQDQYDRGAAFVDGVVERAGVEGIQRLWEDERMLPTPNELDAPGLWLARIELPLD